MMISSHTISVLVANEPGVLARVASLFARRGFNIESLAVGPTEDPAVSRMTIVVSAEGKPLEQITKQLHKLIHVLRIAELPAEGIIERELVLFKVGVAAGKRAEVLEIAEIFRSKVVDVDMNAVVIEATGTPDKVATLEKLLSSYGFVEMARTGRVALARGGSGLKSPSLHSVTIPDHSSSETHEQVTLAN
jgi:acetolactate synthase I/III small subunit